MTRLTEFDLASFLVLPPLDRPRAIQLTTSLIENAPTLRSACVEDTLVAMKAALTSAETVQAKTQPRSTSDTRRVADVGLDIAWTALRDRLAAYAALPEEIFPKSLDARRLASDIFPDDLKFLLLPFPEEWSESQRRLDAIETDEWGARLDELAGPEFLANVRRAHASYGELLGLSPRRRPPTADVDLLRTTIHAYILSIVALGLIRDDGQEWVRRTLAPIEKLRATRP